MAEAVDRREPGSDKHTRSRATWTTRIGGLGAELAGTKCGAEQVARRARTIHDVLTYARFSSSSSIVL